MRALHATYLICLGDVPLLRGIAGPSLDALRCLGGVRQALRKGGLRIGRQPRGSAPSLSSSSEEEGRRRQKSASVYTYPSAICARHTRGQAEERRGSEVAGPPADDSSEPPADMERRRSHSSARCSLRPMLAAANARRQPPRFPFPALTD